MTGDNGVAAPARAAIIGCGDVSVVHAEALAPMADDGIVEFAAVCDTNPDAARAAGEKYGVPYFTSHQEMLDSVELDVVHVSTPHDEHVDPSLDSLRAGIDVITEKPLAHSRAEARRFTAEAAKLTSVPGPKGRTPKIGVCLQNRYNVSSVKMRDLLFSEELGDITGAYASVVWTRNKDYYRARPWRGQWMRAGGGLLINQALHTLDLVQWLLGPVVKTEGQARSRVWGEVSQVEDTCEAIFHHESGIRTTFFGTLTAPRARSVEIEVTGENGTATVGPAGFSVHYNDGTVLNTPERQATSSGRTYWGVSHEILIRDFYAKRSSAKPFWISPTEALKCLEMTFDIYDQSDFPERNDA